VVPALSAGVLERGHEAGVRAALTRARRYPQRAVDRNVTGRTVLNVTIARNGRLVDARVVTGSGSDALDRASLEAAARAAFPAAPAELDGERFEYQLGLDYELN
jgi:protein TonB